MHVRATLPWLVEWHHIGFASGKTFQNVLCSRQTLSWEIFHDATDTFVPLSEIPAAIGDQDIECIEVVCSHHVRQDYDNVCREQSTF
jgi:hypothetical protein